VFVFDFDFNQAIDRFLIVKNTAGSILTLTSPIKASNSQSSCCNIKEGNGTYYWLNGES
jgi:hypothetical protein